MGTGNKTFSNVMRGVKTVQPFCNSASVKKFASAVGKFMGGEKSGAEMIAQDEKIRNYQESAVKLTGVGLVGYAALGGTLGLGALGMAAAGPAVAVLGLFLFAAGSFLRLDRQDVKNMEAPVNESVGAWAKKQAKEFLKLY